MIISAKPIRAPRKEFKCGMCNLGPLKAHLVIYGTPAEGGKPFTMRVCLRCIPQKRIDTEPKISAAVQVLKDAREEQPPA